MTTPSPEHDNIEWPEWFYEEQSYAAVHVLADDMTWTPLATSSPHNWFDDTPSPRDLRVNASTALRPTAQRLLDRAATILG